MLKVKVLLCNQVYQVLLKSTNPVGADAVVDVAVVPDEGEHACTAQLGFGCPLCIVTWVVKKTFQLCDSKIIFHSTLHCNLGSEENISTMRLKNNIPLCIVTWVVKKTFQLCDSKIIFHSAL